MVYPTTVQETRRASRVAQGYARLHFPQSPQVRRWTGAGLLLLVTSLTIYLVNPLDLVLTWQTTLQPGTVAYHIWQNPPDSLFVKVYVFNITNADEFLRGEEKIRIKELGPFVYREVAAFNNLTLNDNGTASFRAERHLVFEPERSIGYPGNFTVNTFNFPLLTAASLLGESTLVANLGLRSIAAFLGAKPIIQLSVEQILWGYDDPLITLAHNFAPFFIDFKRLGLLERLYSKGADVSIYTGRNSGADVSTKAVTKEVYSIERYNGDTGFPFWGHGKERRDPETGEERPRHMGCDTVQSSFEGYLFPRKISPDQMMYVYRDQFCRTVPLINIGEARNDAGFKYYLYQGYSPAIVTPTDEENLCYCTKSAGISGFCPPDGFSSVSPCYYHLPLVLSLPHMLYADERTTSMIVGQEPNYDRHMSFLKLQPDLGIPLEIYCRLQVNIMMGKTRLQLSKPFDHMALPIMWLEMEMTELPSYVQTLMWLALKLAPALQTTTIALCATAGIAMIARAFVLRKRAAERQRNQRCSANKLSALQ